MTENLLVVVSEWMARGNIMEFVKANVNADRARLVRPLPMVYIYLSLTMARLL